MGRWSSLQLKRPQAALLRIALRCWHPVSLRRNYGARFDPRKVSPITLDCLLPITGSHPARLGQRKKGSCFTIYLDGPGQGDKVAAWLGS